MVAFTKTRWITLLLVVSFLAAGLLAYQLWQKNGELVKQTELNRDLRTRIDELQKRGEALRRQKAKELAKESELNQNLREQVSSLQTEIEKLRKSEKRESRVIIRADKAEYEKGEMVEIVVTNGLENSIWYMDFGCYPWWKLDVRKAESWDQIELLLPTQTEYGEECIAPLPPESIEDIIKELKPCSEMRDIWNLRYCKGSTPSFIGPGSYRLSLTYGSSRDLADDKKIYSGEFVIRGD